MFNNTKGFCSSIIDVLKFKAMESEDYDTVSKLIDMEAEMNRRLLYERLKGLLSGYGTAMAGVAIGTAVLKNVKK